MSGESDVERALCIVTDWWQELRMLKQSGAKLEPGLSREELAAATDIVGATFRSYFAHEFGRTTFREAITPEPRKIAFWSELVEANNAPSA